MSETPNILTRVPFLPDFRALAWEDRDLYRDWCRRFRVETSEITLTNLFVWRRTEPVMLSKCDGFLIVLRLDRDGRPSLCIPLGEGDFSSTVEELFGVLGSMYPSESVMLRRVPESVAQTFSKIGYPIEEDRDNFDYVYRVEDLAELSGRKYDGKRNHARKCVENNPCEYEELNRNNLDDCFSLATEWCNVRQCDIHPPLAAEFRAIRETFERFEELGLLGGSIRIQGEIQAFAIAETINQDIAIVHFEKANPQIEGLYQVINQWFCQNALSGITWVNREQDLGVAGLRQAKMSYHPDHFVKKYNVHPKTG